jgi:hypothetical protein
LDIRSTEEATTWLLENRPAHGERVEAVFALWELGMTAP